MSMPRVTFFGSFLSASTGSVGPSESVSKDLAGKAVCALVSSHTNPFIRLFHNIASASFSKIDIAVLDVYSTKVVYQTAIVFCLLKARKVKTVAVFHGGGIINEWNSKNNLFKLFLKHADVVTAPSKRMSSFALSKGHKVQYLPNPIDLGVFAGIPQKGNLNYKLLWVRAFSDIYNPDIAIRTLALLKSNFPELQLTMVGPDKGLRHKSEKLVRRLNLRDSVHFVGPVPNKDLIRFYQSHTVFLNTTSFESFGTAVAEAAATALPIVSSKVGELPYIWEHRQNILFVDQLDAENFAKQVRVVLENDCLAREMGVAAAKRVQEFESSKIIAQWIALFDELS
jgi:glycosyltransferase involved in cell wall biosynthesis